MLDDKPENKIPENASENTPENTPENANNGLNKKLEGIAQNSSDNGVNKTAESSSSNLVDNTVNNPANNSASNLANGPANNLGNNTGGTPKPTAKASSNSANKAVSKNSPAPKSMNKLQTKFGRWYRIALLVAFLLIAGIGGESYRFLEQPAQNEDKMVVVEINPGDSFDKVASRLESVGAISNKFKFKLYAKLRGEDHQIQAGVFEVYTNWTPKEVLQQLVYGKPTLERFTLREGLPWWEVAKRVEQAGLAKAEDFKEVIHDPDFLREMGIPFKSAEGFLYPETYFLRKPPEVLDKAQARQIAARLINTFWQKSATVWGDVKPANQELKNLLILASLVEKETGVAGERARVAGVYANRLRLNMLLQCDPTTIYGLGETFNGNLRRKHLQDPANEYNTYQHAGLPPGPICSPGVAALQAALEPEEHKYLYFVATGKNGSHYFNTNLKDHNRDVAKYIAELRKSRQAGNQPKPASDQAAQANSTAPVSFTSNATLEVEQTVLPNATIQEPGLEIIEEELKLNQNATGQNATGQNTAGQNTAGQNTAGQNTAGQNTAGQSEPAQNGIAQSKAGQGGLVQISADKNLTDKTPAGQTPAGKNATVQASSKQNAPTQNTTGESGAVKNEAAQSTAIKSIAGQNATVKEPASQSTANEAPAVQNTPARNATSP